MRRAVLTLALVALLAVPVVAAVGATPAPAAMQTAPDDPDRSGLTVTIHLQADGDARWNVSVQYALDGENETAAFESLLADYRAGADVGPSADVFRTVAAQQSDRVGREMRIVDVERSGDLHRGENATGRLTLSFTWTNFSVVRENELRVADVFDGGWFGRLRAGEQLLIYPPDGYSLDTATPQTRVVDGALQWTGPQTFEDGPAVTFAESRIRQSSIPWTLVGGAVVVALVAGAVTVYLWSRRADGDDGPPADAPLADPETASNPEADDSSTDEPVEAVTDGTSADEAGGAGAVDEELLSDEERVERLLRDHGGRMKQAKIVEETRWSNAKVSQLLSSMADEDRVEKLRIGRENLISLPDDEE